MADLRPAIPVAVEVDTDRYLIHSRTGERITQYEHVYTEYDAGRIRAGYCCINCGEAQVTDGGLPEAFPEHCWVCAYPMRDEQPKKFAEEFGGYTTLGSAKSRAEMLAEDLVEKEKARRKHQKPTSSIWVPRSL